MERAEHLRWCKDRATEYVTRGDLKNAVMSMLSDMEKHPETAFGKSPAGSTLAMLGAMEINNGPAAVQRWIDGFN